LTHYRSFWETILRISWPKRQCHSADR